MSININASQIKGETPSFKGGAVRTYTIKSNFMENAVKTIGEKCSSPHNRLLLGVTALATQPWIDWHNKDVDEKTRKVSCARTIAKIIAGTLVGVIVRTYSIKFIANLTRTPKEIAELEKSGKKVSKWASALMPDTTKENGIKKHINIKDFEEGVRLLRNHRNALGTCLGILVSLFTNFLIDVPITKFLTNLFMKKFNVSDAKKSETKGGN